MDKSDEQKDVTPVEEQAEGNAQADDQADVAAFLNGYGELVKKHGIDFASYPVFVPDGQGGFKIIVQNTPVRTKNQPTKSPFVPEA
jgi:hypothetical protein